MPNPFGLIAGSTPPRTSGKYFLMFKTVPKPHPELRNYTGTWDPEFGLMDVSANSERFEDDSRGYLSIKLYDSLKRQLNHVYGENTVIEMIDEDSVWNGDAEFIHSIIAGDRSYITKWSHEDGSNLDSGISEIWLSIDPEDSDTGIVRLRYVFEGGPSPEDDGIGLDSL